MSDERFCGHGHVVSRYGAHPHLTLGEILPTQRRVHCEMGHRRDAGAEQCNRHRYRLWPISLQRAKDVFKLAKLARFHCGQS